MNQQISFSKTVGRRLCLSVFLLGWFGVPPSFGQHCPHSRIELAKLAAGMEETKDPNVILRSAAIAGPSVISVLRRISKPGMPLDTVPGAAQVSLAKLDDEKAMAELNEELNGKSTFFRDTRVAIPKLLFVDNGKSLAILLKFLNVHPDPILVGSELDNPHDLRSLLIAELADMVEYADDQAYGRPPRSIVDWDNSWKHGKATPIPLSLSIDVQNSYLECLCRKIEWGFPMAMIDLAATGDPRVVPILLKLATIGYPNEGYAGLRAPYAWWVRHDYVETSLAKWGDAEKFAILEHALQIDQTSILKLQVIGGRKAMTALLESNTNPNYGMHNQALFKSLSEMVQDPPLPSNADPTVENLHKWRDWWAKNKDTARFVYPAPYE
jgi:hypothetical protein